LTGFPQFSRQKHLVHDRVDFVKVEHQVELTDVLEILIQHLYEVVNGFEIEEVVVRDVDADAEVETRVTSVNYLEVPKLDEIRVLGVTHRDQGVDFLDEFLLLFGLEIVVPLGQTGLAGPVLDQDELDGHGEDRMTGDGRGQ